MSEPRATAGNDSGACTEPENMDVGGGTAAASSSTSDSSTTTASTSTPASDSHDGANVINFADVAAEVDGRKKRGRPRKSTTPTGPPRAKSLLLHKAAKPDKGLKRKRNKSRGSPTKRRCTPPDRSTASSKTPTRSSRHSSMCSIDATLARFDLASEEGSVPPPGPQPIAVIRPSPRPARAAPPAALAAPAAPAPAAPAAPPAAPRSIPRQVADRPRPVNFTYYFMSAGTAPTTIHDVTGACNGRGMLYALYRCGTFLSNAKMRSAVLPSLIAMRDALHASASRVGTTGRSYLEPGDFAGSLDSYIGARVIPRGVDGRNKSAAAAFVNVLTVSGDLPPYLAQRSVQDAKRDLITEAILEFPTAVKSIKDNTRHVHYLLWCRRQGLPPATADGGGRGGRGRGRGRARAGNDGGGGGDPQAPEIITPHFDRGYKQYLTGVVAALVSPSTSTRSRAPQHVAMQPLGPIPSQPILASNGLGFVVDPAAVTALGVHYASPQKLVLECRDAIEDPEYLVRTSRIVDGLHTVIGTWSSADKEPPATGAAGADASSDDNLTTYGGINLRTYRQRLFDIIKPPDIHEEDGISEVVPSSMLVHSWDIDASFRACLDRRLLPPVSCATSSLKLTAAVAEEQFQGLLAQTEILAAFGWTKLVPDQDAGERPARRSAAEMLRGLHHNIDAALADCATAISEAEAATIATQTCNDINSFDPSEQDNRTRDYIRRLMDYFVEPTIVVQSRVLNQLACLLNMEPAAVESLGLVAAIKKRFLYVQRACQSDAEDPMVPAAVTNEEEDGDEGRGGGMARRTRIFAGDDDDDGDDDAAGVSARRRAAPPGADSSVDLAHVTTVLLTVFSGLASAIRSGLALVYSELMYVGARVLRANPGDSSCLGTLERVRTVSHTNPHAEFLAPAHVYQHIGALMQHAIMYAGTQNGEQKKMQFAFVYNTVSAMMFSYSKQAVRVPIWAGSGGDGKTFTMDVLMRLMSDGMVIDNRMTAAARARTACFGHIRVAAEGGVSLLDGTGELGPQDEVLKAMLMDGGGKHTTADRRPDGSFGPVTVEIETGAGGILSISNNAICTNGQLESFETRRIRAPPITERDMFAKMKPGTLESDAVTAGVQRVLYAARMVGLVTAATPRYIPDIDIVREVFDMLFGSEGNYKQLPFRQFDARLIGHYTASARSRIVQASAMMACGGPDRRVTPAMLADITLGAPQLLSLVMASVMDASGEACYTNLLTFIQTLTLCMSIRMTQQSYPAHGQATAAMDILRRSMLTDGTAGADAWASGGGGGGGGAGGFDNTGDLKDMRIGDGLDPHAYFRACTLVVAVMRVFATAVEKMSASACLATLRGIGSLLQQDQDRGQYTLSLATAKACLMQANGLRIVDDKNLRGCPLSPAATVSPYMLEVFSQKLAEQARVADLQDLLQGLTASYSAYVYELDVALAERKHDRDIYVRLFASNEAHFPPAGCMLPPFKYSAIDDYMRTEYYNGEPIGGQHTQPQRAQAAQAAAPPRRPSQAPQASSRAAPGYSGDSGGGGDEDDMEECNVEQFSRGPPRAAVASWEDDASGVAPMAPAQAPAPAPAPVSIPATASRGTTEAWTKRINLMTYTTDDASEETLWYGRNQVPQNLRRMYCRIGLTTKVNEKITEKRGKYPSLYSNPLDPEQTVSPLTAANFLQIAISTLETPMNPLPLTDESAVKIAHVDKLSVVVISNMLQSMAAQAMPSVAAAWEAVPPVSPMSSGELINPTLRDALRHILKIAYPSSSSQNPDTPLAVARSALDLPELSCNAAIRITLRVLCAPPTRTSRNSALLLYVRQYVLVFVATFGDAELYAQPENAQTLSLFATRGFSRIANDRAPSPDYPLSGLRNTSTLLAIPGMVPIPHDIHQAISPQPTLLQMRTTRESGFMTPDELYVNVSAMVHLPCMRAAMELLARRYLGIVPTVATCFGALATTDTHINSTVGQYVADPYSRDGTLAAETCAILTTVSARRQRPSTTDDGGVPGGDSNDDDDETGADAADGADQSLAHWRSTSGRDMRLASRGRSEQTSVMNTVASRNVAANIGVVTSAHTPGAVYGWAPLAGTEGQDPLSFAAISARYPIEVLDTVRMLHRFPVEACPANIPAAVMATHSDIDGLMEWSAGAAPSRVLRDLVHEMADSLPADVVAELGLAIVPARDPQHPAPYEAKALGILYGALMLVVRHAISTTQLLRWFTAYACSPGNPVPLVTKVCTAIGAGTDLARIITWFYNKNYSMHKLCFLLRKVLTKLRDDEKQEAGELPPGRTAIFLCVAAMLFHLPRGVAVDCIARIRGDGFVDDSVLAAYMVVESRLQGVSSREGLSEHVEKIRDAPRVPEDVFLSLVFHAPLHASTIHTMMEVILRTARRCKKTAAGAVAQSDARRGTHPRAAPERGTPGNGDDNDGSGGGDSAIRAVSDFDSTHPMFQAAVVTACYEIARALSLDPSAVSAYCVKTFERAGICGPHTFTSASVPANAGAGRDGRRDAGDDAAGVGYDREQAVKIAIGDTRVAAVAGYASVEHMYMEHYTAAHPNPCVDVMCSADAVRRALDPPAGFSPPKLGSNRSYMAGWDALGPIISSWYVVRGMGGLNSDAPMPSQNAADAREKQPIVAHPTSRRIVRPPKVTWEVY